MIIQDIYLDNYDWKIRVYYAVDDYYVEDIVTDLVKLQSSDRVISETRNFMYQKKYNIGFTYSNLDKRESLVIIGITSSADEFQNTFDHEKGHLAMHISRELNIDPFSEEFQYLTGEIGKAMFEYAKLFMCDHCRKHIFV